MARPQKRGLDYFPLDVDIDQDDKIQLVEALHGMTGFSVVIKLLMRIYKEGYYYEWGEMEQLLFSKRVNVDINLLSGIVNDCVKYGIFNMKIYETNKVLTSAGIQERYFEATKRRKNVVVVNQYMLISDVEKVNVNINRVDVDINGEIVDTMSALTPQSKVKESKEEESKQEETKEDVKSSPKSLSGVVLINNEPKLKNTPSSSTSSESNFINLELKEVTNFYEQNNFGVINPHVGEKMLEWINDISKDLVIMAMKLAIENSVIKWSYAEGILKNWGNRKFTTVEQVTAFEKQREQQQNTQQSSGSRQRRYGATKEEVVPDWFYTQNEKAATTEVKKVDPDIEERRRKLRKELDEMREGSPV